MSGMSFSIAVRLPDGREQSVELPRPPSFDQFRQSFAWDVRRSLAEEIHFIPCMGPECGGSGWIYDPRDQPCPVEGNKMRDRIKCPVCDGTGRGDLETMQAAYDSEVQRVMARRDELQRHARQAQEAMNKLNRDEWESVKKLILK